MYSSHTIYIIKLLTQSFKWRKTPAWVICLSVCQQSVNHFWSGKFWFYDFIYLWGKKTYHIQKNTLFHQKVKKKYWHLSSWMYIITESVFLCWIWEAGTVKHTYNVFCTFLNIEDATRLNKQFFSLYSLNRLVMQNSWNILVVDQYVT